MYVIERDVTRLDHLSEEFLDVFIYSAVDFFHELVQLLWRKSLLEFWIDLNLRRGLRLSLLLLLLFGDKHAIVVVAILNCF